MKFIIYKSYIQPFKDTVKWPKMAVADIFNLVPRASPAFLYLGLAAGRIPWYRLAKIRSYSANFDLCNMQRKMLRHRF